MKDQVAVIGVGCTKFGDLFEHGYEDLICEAAFEAYADAKIDPAEIQAAYLGTYMPGAAGGKAAVSLGDALRLYDRPITRVENYCATGTDAFRNACLAIASGTYDIVLVLGAEKLKDRGGRGLPRFGHPLLAKGNSAPGLFALAANRYMHTFGVGRETLAKVAVKNHYNGARNPKAHLRMEVTEEQGAEGADDRLAVRPLRLLPDHRRRRGGDRLPRRPRHALHRPPGAGEGLRPGGDDRPAVLRSDLRLPRLPLDPEAAQQAYKMAGISAAGRRLRRGARLLHLDRDLQHRGSRLLRQGRGRGAGRTRGAPRSSGDIPINPSGGLKSFGHPIGASGVRMIYECVTQLRGQAGERQVQEPRARPGPQRRRPGRRRLRHRARAH